ALPEPGRRANLAATMSEARRWIRLTVPLCAVLGSAQACITIKDPNHCENNGSTCTEEGYVCDPCLPTREDIWGDEDACVPADSVTDQDLDQPGCQGAGVGTDTDPTATTMDDPTMMTT